jgi:hypothetical protein
VENYIAQTRQFSQGVEVINGVATIRGFEAIFENTLRVVIGISGVVLFVMLIIGGFKYLTSGGDPKAAESARKTITYSILGLVLIALSYLILVFIETITGINLTTFSVTN